MIVSHQETANVPDQVAFNLWSRTANWIRGKELSREFWIFFAAAFCFDFGFAIFFFLFNLFLLDFGFTERPLGLMTGAMTLGGMIGTIPVGLLAKRVSLHRLLLLGFVLAPAVCALRTFVLWQPAQVGLAFITGLCFCFWTVIFSPVAAKLTSEKNRPFAFSLLFSVGIGSGALGGLLGGYLPGWLAGMGFNIQTPDAKRMVLLLSCLIAAIGVWPVSRLRLQTKAVQPYSQRKFNPFLLRFLPAVAVWGIVLGSFTPFANVFLSRDMKISLSHIGLVFSASQITQVVAVLLTPFIFRRFGIIAGITYTQIATAVALATLARVHGVGLVIAVYLAFTAAQWMSGPGIYGLLMDRVPEEERGSASAANIFTMSLFQAIASALAGSTIAKFGYSNTLTVVAGIAIVAAFLFSLLPKSSGNSSSTENVVAVSEFVQ